MIPGIDAGPPTWTGRDDGPGPEHARWHSEMRPWSGGPVGGAAVLVGFACDEGIRRNGGRPGAAEGPRALREALASLSDPGWPVLDAGDVVVADGDAEAGQARLGAAVRAVLDAGGLPVVLGGGNEAAFGSYLGWAGPDDWAVLNVDAHFDLRAGSASTSGTPFRQIADAERAAGRPFRYGVVGINEASNTRALFATASELGVDYLTDLYCTPGRAAAFAARLASGARRVQCTIDLDVLPASVAPGVSAPAGFGIGVDAVRAVVRTIAASGTLGVLEVTELSPRLDMDGRTAKTAARLIDEVLRTLAAG